jgi:flagellar basal-body rod protein FlgG
MDASMWVAKTGLDAQQTRMSVIANNLSNVNTHGFKRDRALFEDLLYQNIRAPGGQTGADTQSPTGMMLGTGTRIVATEKTHSQGNLISTQNALDIAIQGDGFFQILQSDGTIAYTRDGGFKRSAEGEIVTTTGARLQPGLTLGANVANVTIGQDGSVSTQLFDGTTQQLAVIQIVRFLNPAGLEPMGQNLFRETNASGQAQAAQPGQNGAGKLVQGALEASNVNVVEEMVNMIETQRAYEVNSKAIASADGMLRFVNQNL